MKKAYILFCLIVMAAVFSSCHSKKNFLYLQDMYPEVEYLINNRPETTIKRGDRISIIVTSKEPALALPYNLNVATVKIAETGAINSVEKRAPITGTTTTRSEGGYKVNQDGNIEFPVLGMLRVEGLTLAQVTNMVRDRLVQGGHLKEPIVITEFLNFRYYTLGAIASGEHTVDGDKITLLEAISKAGDLSSVAKLDRILVYRESEGVRKVYVTDIRSKDFFDSPVFYLQQNDIIYVEPRYRKREAEQNVMYYMSLVLSPVMTFATLYTLLKKNK